LVTIFEVRGLGSLRVFETDYWVYDARDSAFLPETQFTFRLPEKNAQPNGVNLKSQCDCGLR